MMVVETKEARGIRVGGTSLVNTVVGNRRNKIITILASPVGILLTSGLILISDGTPMDSSGAPMLSKSLYLHRLRSKTSSYG